MISETEIPAIMKFQSYNMKISITTIMFLQGNGMENPPTCRWFSQPAVLMSSASFILAAWGFNKDHWPKKGQDFPILDWLPRGVPLKFLMFLSLSIPRPWHLDTANWSNWCSRVKKKKSIRKPQKIRWEISPSQSLGLRIEVPDESLHLLQDDFRSAPKRATERCSMQMYPDWCSMIHVIHVII